MASLAWVKARRTVESRTSLTMSTPRACWRSSEAALERAFQVSADNPLVGRRGARAPAARARASAARRAATCSAQQARLGRAGRLSLAAGARAAALPAELHPAQPCSTRSASIWPGRLHARRRPARRRLAAPGCRRRGADARASCRFHKLSQWLSYSLLYPLARRGPDGHRARRADRSRRVPQRRPVRRRAACSCPSTRRCCDAGARGRLRAGRRVARADRRAARRAAAAGATRAGADRSCCRSPRCSKAAPGPPGASSRARRARADGGPPSARASERLDDASSEGNHDRATYTSSITRWCSTS